MRLTRSRRAWRTRQGFNSTFDGVPVAEMIKTILDPRVERLERAIEGKNIATFDELTNGRNAATWEPASRLFASNARASPH